MKRTPVKALLRQHEGLRLKPYRCTANKLTIGYGRNLEDTGISEDEAEYLLENDIRKVETHLANSLPFFTSLEDARQRVLVDMAFNLGVQGLLKFRKMLGAVAARDFDTAAAEMLDSQWASQVGQRAKTLAALMKSGTD